VVRGGEVFPSVGRGTSLLSEEIMDCNNTILAIPGSTFTFLDEEKSYFLSSLQYCTNSPSEYGLCVLIKKAEQWEHEYPLAAIHIKHGNSHAFLS
jgi:hypothetical protein